MNITTILPSLKLVEKINPFLV